MAKIVAIACHFLAESRQFIHIPFPEKDRDSFLFGK
jgi:hypothetical protein